MRCVKLSTSHQEFALRLVAAVLFIAGLLAAPVRAQQPLPIQPQREGPVSRVQPYQYTSGEIFDAGHHFSGVISKGIALVVRNAAREWGEPNRYTLGETSGGPCFG